MNCRDFENNLDGLARGTLMDARSREDALAHERSCARCAARLANERALASGLRALAGTTKDACAPARVEAALLASLRARAASSVARERSLVSESANGAQPAPSEGGARSSFDESVGRSRSSENVRQLSWMKTVAVAALAAAAAVALFMLVPPGVSVPSTKDSVAGNNAAGREQGGAPSGVNQAATGEAGKADETVAGVSGEGWNLANAPAGAGSSTGVGVPVSADGNRGLRAAGGRRAGRAIQAQPANWSSGGRGLAQASSAAGASDVGEITTDFMPLVGGERLGQAEAVHMVRVELPRSALARFGLPVNAEQSSGRVKADVLFGEDGVARAIRFVR